MYEYRAKVASIYDADTLRLDVDCGFSVWLHRVAFRLAGIDAPELGTPGGIEARDWLRRLLPVGTELIAITYKDKAEKYGRWLADLYLPGDTVNSINQQLIDAGHARPYGRGKAMTKRTTIRTLVYEWTQDEDSIEVSLVAGAGVVEVKVGDRDGDHALVDLPLRVARELRNALLRTPLGDKEAARG